MSKVNQLGPEETLTNALRRLAHESSRNASPGVQVGLATAFRRHHRRRRTRNAAVVILAICSLVSATFFFTRLQKTVPTIVKKPSSPVTVPVMPPATNVVISSNSEIKETRKVRQHSPRQEAARNQKILAEAHQSAFLPLPTYDPMVAKDDLQIIPVEMPIQDLRLVGAPVAADIPNRQVRADFVVGHDGTPYAVRLVQ